MAKKPAPKGAARLATQSDLSGNAIPEIAEALNGLVADSYALYTKTKNFHWHVSGPHFRDYHLLFDDQATEIFATIDDLAERCASWAPAPFTPSARSPGLPPSRTMTR